MALEVTDTSEPKSKASYEKAGLPNMHLVMKLKVHLRKNGKLLAVGAIMQLTLVFFIKSRWRKIKYFDDLAENYDAIQ